jgi:hypothetical protein
VSFEYKIRADKNGMYYLDIRLQTKVSKREEVTGNWRNVPHMEPHNFVVFIPNIIRGTK